MHAPCHRSLLLAAPLLAALPACTLHSTATHWHGRTGPDGKLVHALTTTAYGMNLAIVLPVLGDVVLDEVVDEACAHIARSDSNGVRIVETEKSNYWYAIPPLSWLFSPVVLSVTIEYTPSPAALAAAGGEAQHR